MSKASKKRNCPAAGHEITAAECGEQRGSHYACPAECPHNPFAPANYDQLLELEKQVDTKSTDWLLRHAPDRPGLERAVQKAMRAATPHELHGLLAWRILFATDAAGLTCAQRWEQAGFPGLKNDERVLMRAKMKMQIVLLEVHRVLNEAQTEAVDLLDARPEPLVVQDRGFAASASRFQTGLTWSYPLPHFRRMHGVAIVLQEIAGLEPAEIVTEIARHLGGPTDEAGLRRWLAEHFARFNEALTAVGLERRRQMFASLDGKFGKAVYELQRPFAECCEVLDAVPAVEPDDLNDGETREGFADARVWFADEAESLMAHPQGGGAVLGRVLLGQAHWRLEAMGAESLAKLRRAFEREMGGRVRFTGERLDDLAASLAEKQPKADLSLIPPKLLEEPQKIQLTSSRVPAPVLTVTPEQREEEFMAAQDRVWLDNTIPALDGFTPRAAARDPVLRPKLIRLMKSRVRACDDRNLEKGFDYDVNWMLRELGLDEIIFDPPPVIPSRRPHLRIPTDEDELDDLVVEPGPWMNLPPAPPLPARAFNHGEVEARMRAAMEAFERAADAIQEMADSGSTLIEDVDELTAELLDEDAFGQLVPFLIQIWHVFVPRGTRGPELDFEELRDGIQREMGATLTALEAGSSAALKRYLDTGIQPALAQAMAGMILYSGKTLPKKERPDPDTQITMIAVLCAVIAEMDRSCRAR